MFTSVNAYIIKPIIAACKDYGNRTSRVFIQFPVHAQNMQLTFYSSYMRLHYYTYMIYKWKYFSM